MQTAPRVLEPSVLAGGALQLAPALLAGVLDLDRGGVDPDVVQVLLDLLPHLTVIVAGDHSLLQRLHLDMTSSDDPPEIQEMRNTVPHDKVETCRLVARYEAHGRL